MQMSQEVFGQFRRKRFLIAAVVAALVLILTLTFRFMEEKGRIEQQSRTFADNAIQRFDRMFSPLDVAANNTIGLVGLTCSEIRFPLIEKLASLQTVRSILLVDEDKVYCSSIFGASDITFSDTFPELAVNNQRMMLAVDEHLIKGSPVLLFWTPRSLDNRSGIIQVINIELMTNYLLEPTLPGWSGPFSTSGGKAWNTVIRRLNRRSLQRTRSATRSHRYAIRFLLRS